MLRIFTLALLAFIFFWGCSAKQIYHDTIDWQRKQANLSEKVIEVPEIGTVHYLENALKADETLLFIHGFNGNKDNWNLLSAKLCKHYHIIALDLPSQGENPIDMDRNYTLSDQAESLYKITQALKLQKFILFGHSMGGGVSLYFTLKHPQNVKKLVLIDAVGAFTHKSFLQKRLEAGAPNPLLNICTTQQYRDFISLTMEKPPFIPDFLYAYMAEIECKRSAIDRKIFNQILTQAQLGTQLRQIVVKTLILWGRADRIISVKDSFTFRDLIPDSRLVIFDGIGHAPILEDAKAVAKRVIDFIDNK